MTTSPPSPDTRYRIVVCRGPDCGEIRNSSLVHVAFGEAIRKRGLGARCELAWQSCFGRCRQGPNVLVRIIKPGEAKFLVAIAPLAPGQGGALYNGVTPADALRIVDEHVLGGRVIRELIKRPEDSGDSAVSAPAGKTVKELERLLEADPQNPVRALRLAAGLRAVGRLTEAMALYRRVARGYQEQGRLVQALAVCRSILELEPGDAETQGLYAEIDAARTGAPLEEPTRLDDGAIQARQQQQQRPDEVTSVRGPATIDFDEPEPTDPSDHRRR